LPSNLLLPPSAYRCSGVSALGTNAVSNSIYHYGFNKVSLSVITKNTETFGWSPVFTKVHYKAVEVRALGHSWDWLAPLCFCP